MRNRIADMILTTVGCLALAGGCSVAMISAVTVANVANEASHASETNTNTWSTGVTPPDQPKTGEQEPPWGGSDEPDRVSRDELRTLLPKPHKSPELPSGVSTATSFWDAETASGRPMAFRTLASPYWPLGTKVKITYGDKSVVGVVDDFGPAEWAVAQHTPPAIVDLSTKMMAQLTGHEQNAVTVKFQVLEMGDGRSYRTSGTGHDEAMGR